MGRAEGREVKKKASVAICGGRITPGRSRGIVAEAKRLGDRLGIEILLMDARMVFGRVHVESAVEHAARAFKRGTNVASSMMMEVLLYASGERQLSSAIEKMGVRDGTRQVAIVVSDRMKQKTILRELGISADDSVLGARAGRLTAFGVTPKATSGVPKEKAADLALERVALVDIKK